MTGSTLVARLAGMYAAAKATKNNKDVAAVRVRLSIHATPKSRLEAACESATAPANPSSNPTPVIVRI